MNPSRHPAPDILFVGHRRPCGPAIALLACVLLVLATGEVASAGPALEWQTITDLPGGHLGAVAAGDGGLIAVGMRGWADGQPATLTSSDGMAWQRIEDPVLYGRSWQVAVTHGPNGWVIGGRTFTETVEETVHQAAAWRSDDMVAWTPAPFVPDLDLHGLNLDYPHEGIRDIVAGGPGYVAVGNDSDGAVIWTSPDGLAWHRVASLPGADDAVAHDIVALDDGSLVAVGNSRYAAGPSAARAWSSSDGVAWRVERVGMPGMLVEAATDGARIIAVRANDDHVRGGPALSPPLVVRTPEGSWNGTGEPSLDGVRVATLASDGERWVLFGTQRTDAGSAVRGDAAWTSDDGVTWLQDDGFGAPFPPGYEPPSASAIGVAAITWDGERFVAVGALPTDDPYVVRPTAWLGTPETVSLRPVAHDFGRRDVEAGPTAGRSFRVTNIGSGPLVVHRVSLGGADPGQFAIVTDGCSARASPLPVPAWFASPSTRLPPARGGPACELPPTRHQALTQRRSRAAASPSHPTAGRPRSSPASTTPARSSSTGG